MLGISWMLLVDVQHIVLHCTLGIKRSEFGQVGLSLRSAVSTISIIKSKMAPTRGKEY